MGQSQPYLTYLTRRNRYRKVIAGNLQLPWLGSVMGWLHH